MSNFQDARNLEGQKDGKGYQVGIDMVGMVVSIRPKEFNKQGKPTQQIVIADSMGETQTVKIWLGNGPDIMPTDINTQQSFQQLAVNPWQGKIYYKAFWDNMHPPQPSTQLNPQTQAVIDQQFQQPTGQQAAGAIQDRMGAQPPNPVQQPGYNPPAQTPPQDYQVKEREKVLGMCFTNLLAGRLAAVCPTEMEKDLGAIAALWRLSAMCIDGTGMVTDKPNF